MTKDISKRWGNDGSGYAGNKKMMKAIEKYGWGNIKHNVIYNNLSRKEAQEKERELIKNYNTVKNGYNNHPGGTAGTTLYCKHVTKMLQALNNNIAEYKEFIDGMHSFSDDEGWAYQVNLIDYVIRTEIEDYKTYMQDGPLFEALAWLYYISNWILHGSEDIRSIPSYSEIWMKRLKEGRVV